MSTAEGEVGACLSSTQIRVEVVPLICQRSASLSEIQIARLILPLALQPGCRSAGNEERGSL